VKTTRVAGLPGSRENGAGDVGILKQRRDDREERRREGKERKRKGEEWGVKWKRKK